MCVTALRTVYTGKIYSVGSLPLANNAQHSPTSIHMYHCQFVFWSYYIWLWLYHFTNSLYVSALSQTEEVGIEYGFGQYSVLYVCSSQEPEWNLHSHMLHTCSMLTPHNSEMYMCVCNCNSWCAIAFVFVLLLTCVFPLPPPLPMHPLTVTMSYVPFNRKLWWGFDFVKNCWIYPQM